MNIMQMDEFEEVVEEAPRTVEPPRQAPPQPAQRPAAPATAPTRTEVVGLSSKSTVSTTSTESAPAATTTAAPNATLEETEVRSTLREEQDRRYMMSLLKEQENLARLEELRDRQELEHFIEQIEHEKKIRAAMRQEELDRLWSQVQQRREEERRERHIQELAVLKDAEQMRLEIDGLRRSLVERRLKRQTLEAEIAHQHATPRLAPAGQDRNTARLEAARAGVAADFNDTELRLMQRMEERLETLLTSMATLAETPLPGILTTSVADLSVRDIVRPAFVPAAALLASKGIHTLALGPEGASGRPARFAPTYDHSTRSLHVEARSPRDVRLFCANRHGVTELDLATGRVVADFPLGRESRYAINAMAAIEGSGLLGTHNEFGVLRWDAPSDEPARVAPEIATARNLRPIPTGFIFTSDDNLYTLDASATYPRWLHNNDERLITAAATAGPLVFLGDALGTVARLAFDQPDAVFAPMTLGSKVYSLETIAWRGRPWLAAGVRKRTGAYVVLRALAGESPDLLLNVPERVLRVAMPAEGLLLAASERFLSVWNLDRSQQSRVIPLLEVAPLQDFAAVPAA